MLKDKAKSRVLDRNTFIITYITVSILWFFPILGAVIDPLSKICFVWGALLIFYEIIIKRSIYQVKYIWLLLLFVLLYAISVLFNIHTQLYMGIKHIVYMSVSFFILYALDINRNRKNILSLIYKINQIVVAISSLAAIISLVMFVYNIGFQFERGHALLRQGFLENRLFGVYTSPNTGALFALIAFASMCCNSVIKHGKLFKWGKFYWCNLVLQFLYFSLTLSKGGYLTLFVLSVFLLLIFYIPSKVKKFGKIKGIIFSLAIYTAGATIVVCGVPTIQTVMSYLPTVLSAEEITNNQDQKGEEENLNRRVKFVRIETGDDASNGRLAIWSGGLKIWTQYPIWGIADAAIFKENNLNTKVDISDLNDAELERFQKINGNLHNTYLQILVDSGLLATSIFIIFAILVAVKFILFLFKTDKEGEEYKKVGIIFCIIGAIAANCFVESHLLFNRQDPYGLIFWVYLGAGILYIQKSEEVEKKRLGKGKFALICDTPLQLFNGLDFVLNNCEESLHNTDLYIYHQFRASESYSKRIQRENIFHTVYDVKPFKQYSSKVKSKCDTLKKLLMPSKTLKKSIISGDNFESAHYEYIILSFQTSFGICFHKYFSQAQVILIEDGFGSYFGDILHSYTSRTFQLIDRLFFGNSLQIEPVKSYIRNFQLYGSYIDVNMQQLPMKYNEEQLVILQRIFQYQENVQYKEHQIVYLTQPITEKDNSDITVEEAVLTRLSDKALIRVHPRQNKDSIEAIEKDVYDNLWELECINQLNDNNILLGVYSTAQLMPKILMDAEPTIVFLYRLYFKNLEDKKWKDIEAFIERFKKIYRQPEKIFIPNTIEEFNKIMDRLQVTS